MYQKKFDMPHGYTPGADYIWKITIDGTATTVDNMTIKPAAVITQPPSNPYNPTVEDSLKWSIATGGAEPSEQAVYYTYSSAEYQLSTGWARNADIVEDERKWIIPADDIPWYVGNLQSNKQLQFYVQITWLEQTSNAKISYTYFTDSGPALVNYVEKPITALPIARRR